MDFGSPYISLKSQELIATGIPSLDTVIGGGIQSGSIFLINADKLGTYSDMFLKIFLAQGILNKDDTLIASCDTSPRKLMNKLPQEANTIPVTCKLPSQEPLQIAWRYENNPASPSELSKLSCSSSFHFKDYLSDNIVNSSNINYWPEQDTSATYEDLAESIYKALYTNHHLHEQTSKKTNKSILRVGIHQLGSFFWKEPHDRLARFMMKLRAIVHHAHAVAFITFPKYLIQESEIVSRCEQLCDYVIELESFGNNINPLYNDLNGFIKFTKLCTLNSLCPLIKDAEDWAFKLNQKKLIIEKLRLPPESSCSDQREQDIPTAGCLSQANSVLDF